MKVLWRDKTRPVIEVSRGWSRALLIVRDDDGSVTARHLAIDVVDRDYTSTFLGRTEATPIVSAARSFLRADSITGKAHNLLKDIIIMFDATTTQKDVQQAVAALAATLPEGHKLAKVPARFENKEAAIKRYEATKAALAEVNPAPAPATTTTDEGNNDMATSTNKKKGSKKAAPAKAPAKKKKDEAAAAGRSPNYDENSRFVTIVSEDDIRLQDSSLRTVIFRAMAKAGKRGITLGALVEQTKYDLATVRNNVRNMMGTGRVAEFKA